MAELSNSETLFVNVVRPTPEGVGTLLASETAFAARAEWARMSDDKGSLVVVLLDNGGTVATTPRRVTLPTGRQLKIYAKADTSDTAQTVVAGPFTASGSTATDYAFTATLDLAIDSALWNDDGKLALAVAFTVEDTADGANPSSYPAELVLRRNPLGEGTPTAATVFLRKALNLSDLASPSTALTNLGGTTVGKAVFTAVDESAARTALGAGTGDLLDAGTITLANAGLLPIITADKTLGVGPSYSAAIGNSTVVQRTSYGRIYAGNENSLDVRIGPSDGGAQGLFALSVQDYFIQDLMGGFRTNGGTSSTSLEMIAYKSISGEFKAWDVAGATLKTSNGTTVATFGVSNSTAFTFAGTVNFGTTQMDEAGNILFAGGDGEISNAGAAQFVTMSIIADTLTVNGKVLTASAASGTLATTSNVELLTNKSLGNGWIQGMAYTGMTAGTSGAGSATGVNNFGGFLSGPSTVAGYGLRFFGPSSSTAVSRGKSIGVIDYSKPLEIRATLLIYGTALHANCVIRFTSGKIGATDLAGDLTRAGIGCKITGTGALQIHCHNGSAATTTATSFTPTLNQAFDVRIRSDGAGNLTCWVNDVSVGTSTGGPTGDSGGTANSNMFEVQNTDTTTTQGNITFSNFGINYGR